MAKYEVIYKCLLCDTNLYLDDLVEFSEEHLPETLGRIIRGFDLGPNFRQMPQFISHHCKDGSGSLAHFAGFKKVND